MVTGLSSLVIVIHLESLGAHHSVNEDRDNSHQMCVIAHSSSRSNMHQHCDGMVAMVMLAQCNSVIVDL